MNKGLPKNEAQRMAVSFAKLPDLIRGPQAISILLRTCSRLLIEPRGGCDISSSSTHPAASR